jgi:uncharacterized protein YecE (DUF72 family)
MAAGKIRVGISGWRYAGWRGKFYPAKLRQKDELRYASAKFSTIEINGTFYSLQSAQSFKEWAAATPDNFVFAVKGPRFLTHIRRLREVEVPLANFFASGVLELGRKLGPFLWQLPPNFKFDTERLDAFLGLLPRDFESALKLTGRRNKKIVPRVATKAGKNWPLRHALEIRNETFRTPEFIKLLRKRNIALVCADTVEWPRLMDVTSNFFYCRLHGSKVLYASGYDAAAIGDWARRAVAWAAGREPRDAEKVQQKVVPARRSRDVFVYFDNDAKVRAPGDALSLIRRIRNSQGATKG